MSDGEIVKKNPFKTKQFGHRQFLAKTESKTESYTESKKVLDRVQNRVKEKAGLRIFSPRIFLLKKNLKMSCLMEKLWKKIP